jgi:hypothetical protein
MTREIDLHQRRLPKSDARQIYRNIYEMRVAGFHPAL